MPTATHRRAAQRPYPAIAYASPLKTAQRGSLRPAKRQRLTASPAKNRSSVLDEDSQGSNYGDENDPIVVSDSESDYGHGVRPLESELGTNSNRGKVKRAKDAKGKGVELRLKKQRSRNLAQQYSLSPRKRKRDDRDEAEVEQDADAFPDDDDDFESYDGSNTVRSHRDEHDEEDTDMEPVFMKEDDDFMLHHATKAQLNRLRKAELVRLWKVAGIWEGDFESVGTEAEEEHEDLRKAQLLQGLLDARASSVNVDESSGRSNHAMLSRLSSNTNSESYSTPHDGSPTTDDEQSGPITGVRGKSKLGIRTRKSDTSGSSRKAGDQAAPNGRKRYSVSSSTPRNRRARFRDTVPSPPHDADLRLRGRRNSRGSSAASSGQLPSRSPSTSRLRSGANARHLPQRGRAVSFATADDNVDGQDEEMTNWDEEALEDASISGNDDDSQDARKLNVRLRRRQTGADADDEGELPAPRRRSLSTGLRHTPARKAKKRAMKAIKAVDEESDDVEMLTNPDAEQEITDDDPTPKQAAPLTRARRNSEQNRLHTPTSRRLRLPRETPEVASPSTEEEEAEEINTDGQSNDEDTAEQDLLDDDSPTRPRMSGLVGGRTLRSQVRNGHLGRNGSLVMRLEDMDLEEDSDMEVEGSVEEEDVGMADASSDVQDEEATVSSTTETLDEMPEDEGGDAAEDDDLSLANATHGSLVRLRKADLVQMCERRELCTDGTKQQLVEALMQWRAATAAEKPPSSASTAKPQSGQPTASAIHGAAPTTATAVPVLFRDHVHAEDPATPPCSEGEAAETADVVLDLEELGLIDKEIPISQITKGDKIGSGGYKDVYMGKLRGRVKVAICEFRDEMSDMDIREVKLLAEFNHPNIVRLLGVTIPDKSAGIPCMVITELCENGDLFDYIRNVPAPSFAKVLKLMINIAEGLEYLHERKPRVIHRDCKSTNILINRKGVAKVGDFGLARVKSTTRSVIRSLVGTVNWQAPELWHPKPRYDYKVDVFSCAMVYWEMLNGWISEKKTYPWEGHNEHWIYDAVGSKRQRPPVANLRKHWGNDVVDLVERMWQHDPAERPTMTDVIDDLKAILDNSQKR